MYMAYFKYFLYDKNASKNRKLYIKSAAHVGKKSDKFIMRA